MQLIFAPEPEKNVKKKMEEAALALLRLEGLEEKAADAEISISFVSAEEMRTLNRDFRGNDSVTDVLSFPQYERKEDFPAEGALLLGDVVLCTERAKEQALEYGHSPERELVYLFTHSVLHLLGYDHMEAEEKRVMRAREEEVMEAVGLPQEQATGPVTPEDKELYLAAKEALLQAYAPYSGFRVGAALRTADGRIFTGCNVENASYGGSVCAERTACVKAVSEGVRTFAALAIATENGTAMPCGICRQFLFEFTPELRIIAGDAPERLAVWRLSELLPEAFRLADGKESV